MKSLLAVLLSVVVTACNFSPFTPSYTPALLLERSAGLYIDEFRIQQSKYYNATAALENSESRIDAFIAIAQVFIEEARVTDNHEYYVPAGMAAVDAGLSVESDNIQLRALRTSLLLTAHRFTEAKASAHYLISRSPNTAAYYGMLCDAELELGNFQAAVKAVDSMMSLRPGADSYARVSYLRQRSGDWEGACTALQLAVQASVPGTHDAAWTRTTYGDVLMKMGRVHEAREQYELARLERYNFPDAVQALAGIHNEHNHDRDHDHDHAKQ